MKDAIDLDKELKELLDKYLILHKKYIEQVERLILHVQRVQMISFVLYPLAEKMGGTLILEANIDDENPDPYPNAHFSLKFDEQNKTVNFTIILEPQDHGDSECKKNSFLCA